MPNIIENVITLATLATFKGQNDNVYAAKADLAALIGTDTGKTVRAIAAEELATQLIPENAQEALDTLAEIAAWIQAHPGDAAAMNAAIVALQGVVSGLGALATKSTVTETDLDAALAEKVNAASEGNHAHGNMDALNVVTAEKIAAWDAKANAADIPTISLATEEAVLALFN